MDDLNSKIISVKQKYREIFLKSFDAIQEKVAQLRPDGFNGDIFEVYPKDSLGYTWQQKVIDMFENEISKDIFNKWTEILAYRKQFHCKGCATCCNLA